MSDSSKEPSRTFILKVVNRQEFVKELIPITALIKVVDDIPLDEEGIMLSFTINKDEAQMYTNDELNAIPGVDTLLDYFERIDITLEDQDG